VAGVPEVHIVNLDHEENHDKLAVEFYL